VYLSKQETGVEKNDEILVCYAPYDFFIEDLDEIYSLFFIVSRGARDGTTIHRGFPTRSRKQIITSNILEGR
jgi:hypothetical protein